MGGMMDFVMLGVMVLGGAFIWVNKDNLDCIFNPSSCGSNQFPGDCTTDPTAAGCGTDPGGSSGSDCGKLCRDKKCTDYKKNCHTGCKYCCGSGTNSPKCGGTQGSQCGDLCSQGGGSCVANWNQCTTNCTKCPTQATFNAIVAAARNTASAYTVSCGRYYNPVGVRCSISRTCPNGQKYISPLILIAGKSPSAVVSELLAGWKAAHPSGCTTGTGCTKTCPPGGYVLNKTACSCVCNPTAKGCTSSSCCIITDGKTKCQNYTAGPSQTGVGCNSGYYRCRQSDGKCGCCKSASGSDCPGKNGNCTWDCKNAYCWQSTAHDGKVYKVCTNPGQTSNRSSGCTQARNLFCSVKGPCSSYTDMPGAGPYGDYRFANTGRVPERVRLAQ